MNDESAPPNESETELPAIDFQSPGRFSVHNPTSIRSILEQREPAPFRLGEHQPLQRFTSAEEAQARLAQWEASGTPASETLRNLEQTGRCTLDTFVRVLEVLNALGDLQHVLVTQTRSIEAMRQQALAQARPRQRASSPRRVKPLGDAA